MEFFCLIQCILLISFVEKMIRKKADCEQGKGSDKNHT